MSESTVTSPRCDLPVDPPAPGIPPKPSDATTPAKEKPVQEIARFEDKFGDERVIHKTRHGLKVKRTHATPILQMNPIVGMLVGRRVTELRHERGLTLKELAERCGMTSGHPKNRMWEIEKGVRREGLRFGTLYALAIALDVEVADLMPSVGEVQELAGVSEIATPQVRLG